LEEESDLTQKTHWIMKSEEIKQLFEQFENAASELERIECWSAREMQALLGYSKWVKTSSQTGQR
jgi:hypothetical protein